MSKTAAVFISILCIAFISAASIADNCLQQHWGTKKLYQPADTGCAPAPSGYTPVFINYAGRHGARHLTHLGDLLLLQKMLNDAASTNELTGDGLKLKQMVGLLLQIEKKADCGLLTDAGRQELWGIGNRMRKHYPGLFADTVPFKIITTKERRTQQSAQAFMDGAGRPMQQGPATQLVDNDSVELRFFEVCPAYRKFKKKGNWAVEMNKLKHAGRSVHEQNEIINKFFSGSYEARLQKSVHDTAEKNSKDTASDFIDALFSAATLSNVISKEILDAGYTPGQLNIRGLFTCNEFAWLEFVNSAEDFLQKGPGTDAEGIQVRNAVPLLVDFINSTDLAVTGGRPAITARFAHAETMSPFAALLGIKGAANPSTDIFKYDKVWDVSSVIGFSTNLQWILYKSKDAENTPLIKILYNEKPVQIPVATNQFPYYKWNDVRNYYMKKLGKFNVALNSNMLNYLVNLK